MAARVNPVDDRNAHDTMLRKVVAAATVSRVTPTESIFDILDRRIDKLIPRVKALPARAKEEQAEVLYTYAQICNADSGALMDDDHPPKRPIPPGARQAKHLMGMLNWFGADFGHDVDDEGLYVEE